MKPKLSKKNCNHLEDYVVFEIEDGIRCIYCRYCGTTIIGGFMVSK